MTFGDKLKKLRTDRKLTQEELAKILFVSRTAVSKWESERGFPNIESLRAISEYFSVTVDELLSGNELITLAELQQHRKETHIKDRVFGLIDCSMALLLFLPFFAQKTDGVIREVSLLELTEIQPYLKVLYFAVVIGILLLGLLTLVLQGRIDVVWVWRKTVLSLVMGAVGVAIFIVNRQPYAAAFAFAFLIIKAIMLIKRE